MFELLNYIYEVIDIIYYKFIRLRTVYYESNRLNINTYRYYYDISNYIVILKDRIKYV